MTPPRRWGGVLLNRGVSVGVTEPQRVLSRRSRSLHRTTVAFSSYRTVAVGSGSIRAISYSRRGGYATRVIVTGYIVHSLAHVDATIPIVPTKPG